MADVMGAFLKGRQVAQQEQEHQQALEENKLRAMVLKHQIDGLKIEDTLRKRALQAQNLSMLQGQPEADLPTESVTQPNLPSKSYAGGMTGLPGVVSSLIDARNGGAAGPSTMLSDTAQPTLPGTNTTTRRAGVNISGVPEWGVPDTMVRPRSAEEIIRASIAQKMMEPFTLGPDQERIVGGQVVAHGGPRTTAPRQPTRMSTALEATGGDAEKALELEGKTRGTGATNRFTPKDFLLDGEQASGFVDAQGNYYDAGKNPIKNPAGRVKPLRGSGRTTGGMTEVQAETAARAEYAQFARTYRGQHPAPTAAERQNDATMRSLSPNTELPPLETPPPPPSYDKWKVMTPEERQGVIQNPGARITDAEMAKRRSAPKEPGTGRQMMTETRRTAPKKPFTTEQVTGFLKGQAKGKRYTMTDGTQWDYLPDGTIKPVQ